MQWFLIFPIPGPLFVKISGWGQGPDKGVVGAMPQGGTFGEKKE